MNSYQIHAKTIVPISEARKNLSQCFSGEPVAVLSNNKLAGYTISAEVFNQMMERINGGIPSYTKPRFNPTKERMEEIVSKGTDILSSEENFEDGFQLHED